MCITLGLLLPRDLRSQRALGVGQKLSEKPEGQAGPDICFLLPLPPASRGEISVFCLLFSSEKQCLGHLSFPKEKRNPELCLVTEINKLHAVTRGSTAGDNQSLLEQALL